MTNVCTEEIESSQINNPNFTSQDLEKQEQSTPKVGRSKEITKIRVVISEMETRKTMEGSTKLRAVLFSFLR